MAWGPRSVVVCEADAATAAIHAERWDADQVRVYRLGEAEPGMPVGRVGHLDYAPDELLKRLEPLREGVAS